MSATQLAYQLIGKDAASPAFQRVADAATAAADTVVRCRWLWRWADTAVRCPERAIPGGALCADHLIERERPKP